MGPSQTGRGHAEHGKSAPWHEGLHGVGAISMTRGEGSAA